MKKDLTELVFILDRSGSMQPLVNDTIGGFNSFIEQQKDISGEAKLTTVLFDDQYELLHNGINLKDIKELTFKDYFTRGSTALLDAIGKTINEVENRLDKTDELEKPSQVIFVITTDGEENASIEFTIDSIKNMINVKQNEYAWKFIFLGANIDAISTAKSYGVMTGMSADYTASSSGVNSVYNSLSSAIGYARGANGGKYGKLNKNWADDIK